MGFWDKLLAWRRPYLERYDERRGTEAMGQAAAVPGGVVDDPRGAADALIHCAVTFPRTAGGASGTANESDAEDAAVLAAAYAHDRAYFEVCCYLGFRVFLHLSETEDQMTATHRISLLIKELVPILGRAVREPGVYKILMNRFQHYVGTAEAARAAESLKRILYEENLRGSLVNDVDKLALVDIEDAAHERALSRAVAGLEQWCAGDVVRGM